ncbi:MAG: DNA mismatch repair protein MutS [Clostridia bacterium]|nr:DNA mismatch repair protein MutS [Clostridia bacterium]
MEKEKKPKKEVSDMMEHYRSTKKEYQDAILFYRLGDFYEMFDDDAILVSKLLELTLTARACGAGNKAPMCGVPFHSAESYIAKLLKLGHKVAICEQIGEADGRKQMKREVVRVITPGTVTSDIVLEDTKNNFILCVARDKNVLGVSYADISTGEFFTAEYAENIYDRLSDLIAKIQPAEIICNFNTKETLEYLPINKLYTVPKPYVYLEKSFLYENALETLKSHFGVGVLTVYEIGDSKSATIASGALLDYLMDTQKVLLKQITKIKKLDLSKFMIIDSIARQNLEITETIRHRKKNGTLLSVLDNTKTSMGARLFRQWLEQPLKDEKEINFRLDGVEELFKNIVLRENLSLLLKSVQDIERLTSKIGMKSIMPRDCKALKETLILLPSIKKTLIGVKTNALKNVFIDLEDMSMLVSLISQVISDEPSAHLKDGGFIKTGFNKELDRLNSLKTNAGMEISKLEMQERQRTGIASLRVGFNRVYGYYIEVPKNLALEVPVEYVRKATVANADRYFNESIKKLENELMSADDTAKKIEIEIFTAFREKLIEYIEKLQKVSKAIATLDCLISLSVSASKYNYVRPLVSEKIEHISIEDGRHPVVEAILKSQEFIANSTYMDCKNDKILVLTGPNMAGKSTYMRQVAIITLMAHIGSFVPAKSAEIAITDRIFTRVGASDDLASGQSTFMVEMMEMANILNNATDKSLIILDEIGRGTSTFDGLSIAWAIVEHFSKHKSKVLFATHYHELSELEGITEGVKNYQISVKEANNSIIFLRKIVRGGANKSFGIEVAALAGIPEAVISRAKEISHNIAQEDFNIRLANTNIKEKPTEVFVPKSQVEKILESIDINKLSPLEAFEVLQDLIKKAKG